MEQKIIKEFPNKVRGLHGLNKLWLNSCEKLARRSSCGRLKTARTDDNIDAVMFFYSVIFIYKLDIIRKDYVIWLQIYHAAILLNIIKIDQQLTE